MNSNPPATVSLPNRLTPAPREKPDDDRTGGDEPERVGRALGSERKESAGRVDRQTDDSPKIGQNVSTEETHVDPYLSVYPYGYLY